jgi:quercetin dioxygenase-like cupin family protein
MADATIVKVDSAHAPRGSMGQRYLATGKSLSMRLWQEEPGASRPAVAREYETVGYVIRGRAKLYLGDEQITLAPGNSWVVPKGTPHRYEVIEHFEAVEATHPPAEIHDRDRDPTRQAQDHQK